MMQSIRTNLLSQKIYIPFFLAELQNIAKKTPRTETYIMKYFEIERIQARKWLVRAVEEGLIDKENGKDSYTAK